MYGTLTLGKCVHCYTLYAKLLVTLATASDFQGPELTSVVRVNVLFEKHQSYPKGVVVGLLRMKGFHCLARDSLDRKQRMEGLYSSTNTVYLTGGDGVMV